MQEVMRKTFEGTMGFFCPRRESPRFSERGLERGYVQLRNNSYIELTTLNEDVLKQPPRSPRILTGISQHSGLVLVDVTRTSRSSTFGRAKASAVTYQCNGAIANIDSTQLASLKTTDIAANYFNVHRWTEIPPLSADYEHHQDGRLRAASFRAEQAPEESIRLTENLELYITTHWATEGPEDRMTIHAPLVIGCRSKKGVQYRTLMNRILYAQLYMSLAFGRFVTAESAYIDLTFDSEDPRRDRPQFWHSTLMAPAMQAEAHTDSGFHESLSPSLSLKEMGGIEGVKRWIRFVDRYEKVARALAEPLRYGRPTPHLRLMEIATAIEYWVNENSRRRWTQARKGKNKKTSALLLAEYLGDPFQDWVGGDSPRWANEFWGTYNKLKHEVSFRQNDWIVAVLADSGALLLTAAILNRIVGSTQPGRKLFTRNWRLGGDLKDILS